MKCSRAVPSEKTRGGSLGPCHLSHSEPSPGPRFAEEMKAVFLGFWLLKLSLRSSLLVSLLPWRKTLLPTVHPATPTYSAASSTACPVLAFFAPMLSLAPPGLRVSRLSVLWLRTATGPPHVPSCTRAGCPGSPFLHLAFTTGAPERPGRSRHTSSPEWLAARLLVLRFSKPTLVFADFAFARLSLPSADVRSFSCRRRRSAGSLPPLTFPLALSRSFSSQQCEYFPKPSPR